MDFLPLAHVVRRAARRAVLDPPPTVDFEHIPDVLETLSHLGHQSIGSVGTEVEALSHAPPHLDRFEDALHRPSRTHRFCIQKRLDLRVSQVRSRRTHGIRVGVVHVDGVVYADETGRRWGTKRQFRLLYFLCGRRRDGVAKEITNECAHDTSLLQTTVFVCAVLLSVDLMYSLRGTRRRGDPDASQLLQHLH